MPCHRLQTGFLPKQPSCFSSCCFLICPEHFQYAMEPFRCKQQSRENMHCIIPWMPLTATSKRTAEQRQTKAQIYSELLLGHPKNFLLSINPLKDIQNFLLRFLSDRKCLCAFPSSGNRYSLNCCGPIFTNRSKSSLFKSTTKRQAISVNSPDL